MHKETRATSIPAKVKAAVYERDGGRCILCGKPGGPHCHVIRRSAGGMGVEENIVTLCDHCHYAFDEGLFLRELEPLGFRSREDIQEYIYEYMRERHPGWTSESVKYRKWDERL